MIFFRGLNKVDVLLISPDMYSKDLPIDSDTKVFLLTKGEPSSKGAGMTMLINTRLEMSL